MATMYAKEFAIDREEFDGRIGEMEVNGGGKMAKVIMMK